MEGKCYALIWGILHFRQYLHRTHFTLRTDHKPLEWLATIFDTHGRRGRWIDMLQDFSFKIVHRPSMRHTNADALSQNLVGQAVDDDDFRQEIQDDPNTQNESDKATERVFAAQYGQDLDLFRLRRQLRELTKHHRCCFGINHWRWSDPHQLFMLDSVATTNVDEETDPDMEVMGATKDDDLEAADGKQTRKRGPLRYYGRRQQLELVLAAQKLSEPSDCEIDRTRSGKEEDRGLETKDTDIWRDATYMALLREGMLPDTIELEEVKRARKRASNYCWKEQRLYFKEVYVPKPEERIPLVVQMHEDLGHYGEQRMLAKICRRYF